MADLYTAVCMQVNRKTVSHRREIMELNLKRCLQLIDYAPNRIGFPEYAPVRLISFPEVFMQGWNHETGPYSTIMEKRAKDIAIRIPGDETDILAEKAKQYNTYIAGTAHEVVPELGEDYVFNCAFIIDPIGEVIYKYHKYNPYPNLTSRDDISPHDIWDRYIKVMDGKYGRKKGDILSCFFPVIETEIGKIGHIICNDGFYLEPARVLGLQGCEVMLRCNGTVSWYPGSCPPYQQCEIQNRAHAIFSLMYVVATEPGDLFDEFFPVNVAPGHSMIIDFHGAIICEANYEGEGVTGAVIDIEALRKRRTAHRENYLTQLRTEVYKEMYPKPIYPKNLFLKGVPPDFNVKRMEAQPIEKFIAEGIFIPPSQPR